MVHSIVVTAQNKDSKTYEFITDILKDIYEEIFSFSDLGNYEDNSVPVMAKIKVGEYEVNIEKAYYNGMELTILFNVIGDNIRDILDPKSKVR